MKNVMTEYIIEHLTVQIIVVKNAQKLPQITQYVEMVSQKEMKNVTNEKTKIELKKAYVHHHVKKQKHAPTINMIKMKTVKLAQPTYEIYVQMNDQKSQYAETELLKNEKHALTVNKMCEIVLVTAEIELLKQLKTVQIVKKI